MGKEGRVREEEGGGGSARDRDPRVRGRGALLESGEWGRCCLFCYLFWAGGQFLALLIYS